MAAVYNNALPLNTVSVLLVDANGNAVAYSNKLPVSDDGDTAKQILGELQAIRRALVVLACDGGKARPSDFEPDMEPAPQNVM